MKIRTDFVFRLCREGPSVSFSVVNPDVPQTLGPSRGGRVLWELGEKRARPLSPTTEKPGLVRRRILLDKDAHGLIYLAGCECS